MGRSLAITLSTLKARLSIQHPTALKIKLIKDLREHSKAPTSNSSKQSGAQIPGGVYGVTAIKSKSRANDKDYKANHYRYHPLVGRIVVLIYDGKDAAHQQSRANNLPKVQ